MCYGGIIVSTNVVPSLRLARGSFLTVRLPDFEPLTLLLRAQAFYMF